MTINISSPEALIRSVPVLLGFRPVESLVIIAMADKRVVCTARIDLADLIKTPALSLSTVEALMRSEGMTFLVVAVSETPRSEQVRIISEMIAVDLDTLGGKLADILTTDGKRWWSALCSDRTCCPSEGKPVGDKISEPEVNLVYEGKIVASSREEMLAPIKPASVMPIDTVLAAEQLPRLTAEQVIALADGEPTDLELAQIALSLSDLAIRDAVWLLVDSGSSPNLDRLLSLVAQRVPSPLNTPALFLRGWSAWRNEGSTVLAYEAVEMIEKAAPTYVATTLLRTIVTAGVSPKILPKLAAADL